MYAAPCVSGTSSSCNRPHTLFSQAVKYTYSMNLRLWSLATVLVAVHAHAFQLPFGLSSILGDSQTVFSVPKNVPPIEPSNKVAIIGAGAGGSSAAFWIASAKRRYGLHVEIDVFERESYVGGRTCRVTICDAGVDAACA